MTAIVAVLFGLMAFYIYRLGRIQGLCEGVDEGKKMTEDMIKNEVEFRLNEELKKMKDKTDAPK